MFVHRYVRWARPERKVVENRDEDMFGGYYYYCYDGGGHDGGYYDETAGGDDYDVPNLMNDRYDD